MFLVFVYLQPVRMWRSHCWDVPRGLRRRSRGEEEARFSDPASPTSPGPMQHSPTSPIERTTASDRISGPRKVDVSIRTVEWHLCSTATLHSTVKPLLDGHSTQYSGASVGRSLRTIQSAQYRGTFVNGHFIETVTVTSGVKNDRDMSNFNVSVCSSKKDYLLTKPNMYAL